MSDDDLEELRAQTESGDRLDSEADVETDDALVDAIAEQLDKIDDGELAKTVSVWDGETAALVAALNDRPEDRQRIADGIAQELGAEEGPSDAKVSDVLKLALRLGLRGAPDDVLESVREADEKQDSAALDGL